MAGALVLLSLGSELAHAADVRWKDPVSGVFSDASKWDGGVVPSSADTAIFDATGAAYTVNMGPSRTVGALDVQSTGATVLVQGSAANNHVTLTATNGVTVAGSLVLESANGGYTSNLSMPSGTLHVLSGGQVTIGAGSGGPRVISGSITNEGSFSVQQSLTLSQQDAVYTNRGTWTVDSGDTMAVVTGTGQIFRQEAGSFTDTGFTHLDNARFELTGGAATGFVTLRGGALVIDADASDMGPAEIITGNATSIEGVVHVGQHVLVQGNSFTGHITSQASAPITVAGRLTLRSANAGYSTHFNLQTHLLSIAPTGVLSVEEGNGGTRQILGNITNDGTVIIADDLTLPTAGATYLNRGNWTVTSAGVLRMTPGGQRFQQVAGVLTLDGFTHLDSGSFDFIGGEVLGTQWIHLRGTALDFGVAAVGAAKFLVGDGCTLAGVIREGQHVLVQGNSFTGHMTLSFASDVVVEGELTQRSANAGYNTRVNMQGYGLTVAPTGTYRIENGNGGDRYVWGSIVNEGTVTIAAGVPFEETGALYVNRGTWTVTSTGQMLIRNGVGQAFRQEAGSLTLDGFTHLDSGSFALLGGEVLGSQWIHLRGTALDLDPLATGAAKFLVGNSCTLAGVIHEGQHVLVQGNGFTGHMTLLFAGDVVVEGELTQRSANAGYNTRVNMQGYGLTVRPTGTYRVENGNGGDRYVWGSIVNEGTVTIAAGVPFEQSGALYVNRGSWTVTASGQMLMRNGTGQSFRQESGVLALDGFTHLDSGSLDFLGGEVVGSQWINLRGSALEISAGSLSGGKFLLGNASSIAGVVHPGQHVLVQGNGFTGHITATAAADVLVEGNFTLRSANAGYNTRFNAGTNVVTIADTGTFSVEPGNGGDRIVYGTLQNHGRLQATTPVSFQGAVTNNPGGRIAGTSTLTFSGGLSNFGILAPGTQVGHGVVTVAGSHPVPELEVRIGGTTVGTEYDRATLTGTATLSGLLRVSLDDGYLPPEGQTFTILTAGARSGQFDGFEGLEIGTGRVFLLSYTPTSVVLTAAKLPSFHGTPSAAPVAGQPFDLTVEARDEWDALEPGYRGTAFFSSTDASATLPAPYTFDAVDNGVHVFQGLVLHESGTRSITMTDVDDPLRRGIVSLTVAPAAFSAAQTTVSASPTSLEADGGSTTTLTVIPRDSYGNRIGAGHAVVLSTTNGTLVGSVVDAGNGTYTQKLRAPLAVGSASVSATVDGGAVDQQATVEFTTDLTPPARVTAQLVSRTGQSVTLSWTASTSADVAGYRVVAEALDGSELQSIDAGATLGATVSNLPACAGVRFAVQPYDLNGNVGQRSPLVETATWADGAPDAPAALTATARDGYVSLSFTPSTSCDVSAHRVLRTSAGGVSESVLVAELTSGSSAYDTLVVNDTAYTYEVRAVDAEANVGAPSPTATATPTDLPDADAASGFVAAGIGGGVIELTWLDVVGEVVGYRVYRAASAITDTALATLVAETALPAYDDLPASDGTWHYVVTWLDPAGNESTPTPSLSAVSDRVAPNGTLVVDGATPVGIGARTLTLTLDEQPAQDPTLSFTAPGAPQPVLLALTVDPGDATRFTGQLTVVEGTPAGDGSFTLLAADSVGNDDASLLGSALPVDGVRPTAALSTTPLSPVSATTVTVSLTASEGLSATPTLTFTPAGGAAEAVELSGADASWSGSLVITEQTPDGAGAFSAALVDAAGNTGDTVTAGASLTVDSTSPSAPVSLVASVSSLGQVQLTWQPGAGGASSYRVYRSSQPLLDVDGKSPIGSPTTSSYLDLPPADGLWYWAVTAVDAAGNEGPPSDDVSATSDQTPPNPPTGLSAVASDDGVILSWTAPSGEQPSSYSLYRSGTTFAGDISAAAPLRPGLTETTTLDRPPAEGTYHYVVAAEDAVGLISDPSNEEAVSFDAMAPRIIVSGVADGQHAKVALTPVITIEDLNLDTSSATLDGQPFTSGTTVSDEGTHVLVVTADDVLAHAAEATVTFTLDYTAPVLDIAGVADGALYTTAPTPIISASDDNLLSITTKLNGVSYASGTPIQADGSYTLIATARDRAGNSTSTTLSFTVDLPPTPVPTVHAAVNDDGIKLSWTPSTSTDLAQYRVLRNGQPLCLHSATTCDGGALPIAPETARFEVRPIDALGQLGPARTLTVPPLRVRLVSVGTALDDGRTVLTRGAFDSVLLSVQNDDLVPYTVGPATVTLTNAEGAEQWQGENDVEVEAVAEAGTPVDVVVYAHTELSPSDNDLRLRLQLGGDATTSITWDQTWPADMRFPPGPTIEPVHGPLIRGTEASIALKLTNHGSAPLQVVTASNGGAASPDLFVGMRDPAPDGFNLLSAVTDTTKGTLQADGRRVATLAPSTSMTFAPVTLLIPNDAPDLSQLVLEARRIHTGYGGDVHLDEAGYFLFDGVAQGFYDELPVNVAPPPYLVTATTDKGEYKQGELVLISGVATDTETGEPALQQIVKLVVSQGGFDQTFYTRTDDAGLYTYPFYPGLNTAGLFSVSAVHPVVVAKEQDASFVVHGLRLDPGQFNLSLSKNASYPVGLTLRNTGETPATAIDVQVIDPSAGDGVTAALRQAPAATLAAKQSVTIVVDVSADAIAPDSASFEVVVTSGEGIERRTTIAVQLFGATPSPWIQPRFLDVSLLAGSASTRSITVENRGYGAWENVRIEPPTNVPFLSVPTSLDAGTVAPNGSFSFDVLFSPQESEASALYNATLLLKSDNFQDVPIEMTVSVTTDATGTVAAHVYNVVHALDPNHVDYDIEGANVRLQSQDLYTLTFQGLTDANGDVTLPGIPAGRYTYVVSKSGFQTVTDPTGDGAETGTLVVEPSLTSAVEVGLVESLVDVEWTVTPTTITDNYDIVVSTTYETQVPVPVVDMVPAKQHFDMAPGATRSGQIELVNLGVVSAYDVQLDIRQNHYLDVQLPFDRIAELPAQSRIVVPFTVHLKTHASPPPTPCTEFEAFIDVKFQWFCVGAGIWLPGAAIAGTVNVKSHEANVHVEPNTIVRSTYYNCPGFENGEGVIPPGVNVSNQEGSAVEICDCGRMTTAGIGLPTLASLLEALGEKVVGELDKLKNHVKASLGLPDPPDLGGVIDAATDAAGEDYFGAEEWGKIKEAGQKMDSAIQKAEQAASDAQDAIEYIEQNTCEPQTLGQNISTLVASIGSDLAEEAVNQVLGKYTGGLVEFKKVHTKFDKTCLEPGEGSQGEIPPQSSSFGFGTMQFSVAKGCGAERGSCCPVSIAYVDHTVICHDLGVSTSQSGGGPSGGGNFLDGGGGGGGGGYSGSSEGMCER